MSTTPALPSYLEALRAYREAKATLAKDPYYCAEMNELPNSPVDSYVCPSLDGGLCHMVDFMWDHQNQMKYYLYVPFNSECRTHNQVLGIANFFAEIHNQYMKLLLDPTIDTVPLQTLPCTTAGTIEIQLRKSIKERPMPAPNEPLPCIVMTAEVTITPKYTHLCRSDAEPHLAENPTDVHIIGTKFGEQEGVENGPLTFSFIRPFPFDVDTYLGTSQNNTERLSKTLDMLRLPGVWSSQYSQKIHAFLRDRDITWRASRIFKAFPEELAKAEADDHERYTDSKRRLNNP